MLTGHCSLGKGTEEYQTKMFTTAGTDSFKHPPLESRHSFTELLSVANTVTASRGLPEVQVFRLM
ncbi:hypothetical protein BT69DRAFT_265762 [Atractiella rhizophila]|nr:hypothetical protein BT69DRAFT_265762 [Atractiella rhizophila]